MCLSCVQASGSRDCLGLVSESAAGGARASDSDLHGADVGAARQGCVAWGGTLWDGMPEAIVGNVTQCMEQSGGSLRCAAM